MIKIIYIFVIWLKDIGMLDFIEKMNLKAKIFKNLGLFSILIALIIVYSGALSGSHDFYPNDKVSSMNVKEAVNKSENYPYWFPWMMGGLPSVHSFQNISDYYSPNYIFKGSNQLGMPWFWNFVLHLFFGGVGLYLLLRKLNLDRLSAAVSGMAFSIMPHVTAMLVYGHGSQIMTIAYMPWVFYTYLRLRDESSLKNLGFFSLIVGLQILRGHPQIAYYTWLMLSLCFIVDAVYLVFNKQKNIKFFLFSIAGLGLGVLSSLSVYIPSLSYLPYSTRVSGEGGGMGFEDATAYSFSFGEILTFFIPSYYGFGNDSYWGSMLMTNFPNYMGIVILLFGFYGLIRYRWTKFKLFVSLCSLVFLILSFGGDFYRFLYDNLFYFSKFRNPMYMLIVVQFCVVVLAGMGVRMLVEDLKNRNITLPIYLGICILIFSVLSIVLKGLIVDSVSNLDIKEHREGQYIKSRPDATEQDIEVFNASQLEYVDKKTELIQSMIASDLSTMAMIVAICFSGIIVIFFAYPKFKSSNYLMYILSALIALSVFYDMFKVNKKLMYPENLDYLSKDVADKYSSFYEDKDTKKIEDLTLLKKTEKYSHPEVVDKIKKYKEDNFPFRILDPKRAQNNEWARHHIENILGYHPAHLSSYRIIEDFKYNNFFLDMMNVKYQVVDYCIKSSCLVDVCMLETGPVLSDPGQCIDYEGDFSEQIYSFHESECPGYARWEPDYIIPVNQEQCLSSEIRGDWVVDNVIDYGGMDRAFFVEGILWDKEGDKDKKLSRELYNLPHGQSPDKFSYITQGYENLELNWADLDSDLGWNTSAYYFKVEDDDKVINIDNSNPNELRIEVETSGPQFLAISEIYYPNGWYASIDGVPTEIFEVNDLIRGVYIDSKGTHEIKMWYDPVDLKWGRWLSSIAFIIIFGMIFSDKIKHIYRRLNPV